MLELQAAHLKFDAVTCAFGSLRVVDDVHLEIQPGEHVTLIGSNGSGKNTLLRAILGLHPLGSGRILLNASDAVTAADWKARRARIAWIPQRQATGQFPISHLYPFPVHIAPAPSRRS